MPSSVIRAHRYDAAAMRLDINFVSGARYSYFDVPEQVAQALASAPSKGRYFQHTIRDRFPYARTARFRH